MSAADPYTPLSFKINEVSQDTPDVFSLSIEAPEGLPFKFKAGQFNMLYAFGVGESAISISSDPTQKHSLIHTIRAVGPVTKHLTELRPNQTVSLRGPFGQGWPVEKTLNQPLMLIAGGIGLAPLRPVIYQYLAQSKNPQDLTVLYGARTPYDILYEAEIKQWQKQCNFKITVDHAPSAWSGPIGVVTNLIQKNLRDPKNTNVFMCGPEIMMRFCLLTLQQCAVPRAHIHVSMERHMQCGFGQCGHCQWGPYFICKDGPVMPFDEIESFFYKKAL